LAERLNHGLSKGEILISVHTDDPARRRQALAIFEAENVEYIYEEPLAA
jgi:hypothetical protein